MTASDEKTRLLEAHMSQGNYAYLSGVKEPHVVTNFWKRVLRYMRVPLVPFTFYDKFKQLGSVTMPDCSNQSHTQLLDLLTLADLKRLLNSLPHLNFWTLKLHIFFFTKVVANEAQNRMTPYNIAVTVGPNIIRPHKFDLVDFDESATVYDVLVQMIENYEVLFDRQISIHQMIEMQIRKFHLMTTTSDDDDGHLDAGQVAAGLLGGEADGLLRKCNNLDEQGEEIFESCCTAPVQFYNSLLT